jgi:hypothetical protein
LVGTQTGRSPGFVALEDAAGIEADMAKRIIRAELAVWDQFKATREKGIIPAIYKGDANDAKKITNGIQSERLSKMWGIMSCKVR